MRICCVGAGFTGAVIARDIADRFSKDSNLEIDVYDQRETIGGNCATKIDRETDVTVHLYGPHIFNTNDREIWAYVNRFDRFHEYRHRVKACTASGEIFSIPINLHTINQFYRNKMTPDQARKFIQAQSSGSIESTDNFESKAIQSIGWDLYRTFFQGYTEKQWGRSASEIPSSTFSRLPIRYDYNDQYHPTLYSGIPFSGYSGLISKILDHSKINVFLNQSLSRIDIEKMNYDHVFYSGCIDQYFEYRYGMLDYRSLEFNRRIYDTDAFQGCSQMNYCDRNVLATRSIEYQYFEPLKANRKKTVVVFETSKNCDLNDIPYYPVRNTASIEKFSRYKTIRHNLENKITFCGRLGSYRYLNMDQVIKDALVIANHFLS